VCRPQVLLLHTESDASGLNLPRATHLVLTEPASGTKGHAQAIEAQAVGRVLRQCRAGKTGGVPIQIVRLMLRDSPEQDRFEKTHLSE
jgi:hypothetical protein